MSPKSGNQPLVYDENLLAKAPEVTQGQRQEGYDADILNPSPPPASRTPAPTQPYRDHPDVESGSSGHDKHFAAGGYDHVGQSAKKPFWKTPKGIIVIAVLAVAVIAAVVGGAVGGTVGKDKDGGPQFPAGGNETPLNTTSTPPTGAALTPMPSGTGGSESGGAGGGAGAGSPTPTQSNGSSTQSAPAQASGTSSAPATMSSQQTELPTPGQSLAGDGV